MTEEKPANVSPKQKKLHRKSLKDLNLKLGMICSFCKEICCYLS